MGLSTEVIDHSTSNVFMVQHLSELQNPESTIQPRMLHLLISTELKQMQDGPGMRNKYQRTKVDILRFQCLGFV